MGGPGSGRKKGSGNKSKKLDKQLIAKRGYGITGNKNPLKSNPFSKSKIAENTKKYAEKNQKRRSARWAKS